MTRICKTWAKIFTGAIVFLLSLTPVSAKEQITDFSSEITINSDTSIQIEETIKYTTDEDRHGIYRYVPVRYTQGGLQLRAKIKQVDIRDSQGTVIPYETSWENGNIVWKIGDAETTFTGAKTYVLTYVVENAVFAVVDPITSQEHAELFWDITGEGWQMPVVQSSVIVRSPNAKIISHTCYAGTVGTSEQSCLASRISETESRFTLNAPLNYGENFTVAMEFDPAGGIILPTPYERLLKKILENVQLLAMLFPGIFMFGWWWRQGRDWRFLSWNVFSQDDTGPQQRAFFFSRRPIPMVYEPFKELTPGEAGALHDEKVDIQDVIAEIIDLARQKFLKIERTETKKLLWKDTDYTFTRLSSKNSPSSGHQAYLLESIFGEKLEVKLSELKGTFGKHIEKTKQLVMNSLTQKKLFTANPRTVRSKAFGGAVALLIILFFWMAALLDQGVYWAVPLFAVSAVVSLVCAFAMPAKTAKGYNLALQTKGLQRSIQSGAWRAKINEKHLFFEEVLPFAMALGVVKQLTRDMDDLKIQAPEYLAADSLNALTTASLVDSFASAATSNLTYNPESSSWSGGSGFSGGSSGGGGGGGGGGSW